MRNSPAHDLPVRRPTAQSCRDDEHRIIDAVAKRDRAKAEKLMLDTWTTSA
jgi:DNA-binding GntR family transcriptional regulator